MAASARCSHGWLNRCGELGAVVVFVHVVVGMSTGAFDDLRDDHEHEHDSRSAPTAAGGCVCWRRSPLDTAFGLLGVVG